VVCSLRGPRKCFLNSHLDTVIDAQNPDVPPPVFSLSGISPGEFAGRAKNWRFGIMCRNLLLGFTLFLAGAAQADTLFHWRFDGSCYDSVVSDTDVVNSHVATKFADSGGPSPVLAIEYSRADPWYNTVGTSADFQNDPVSNDPGVGLRVSDAGPDSMLDLGTVSACTVEAFVCPYFDSRQSVILRKYSPGCYYIDTRPASHSYSGKGVFAVRLANATFDTGDNGALCHDLPYEANQWYHVALVWTGSKMKFYVNGVQSQQLGSRYDLGHVPGTGVAEVDFPGPIGDTERALGIGCIIRDNQDPPASSGQFFYGRIDEMRISDVALAPSQFLLNAEPELAFNPSPHSCAPDVRPDVNLVWSPGIGAASHDVYLGTNSGDVNDGTGGTFRGNQEPNSYDPEDLLEFGRTYYWRIDEVGATTVRGYVWQFAVEDGKAGNPGPPNESSGVAPAVVLSWTPGVLAERHDVYLGTDFDDVNDAADPNVLPGRGPQDVNSYNPPGDLQTNVTYYWRIDEVSGATVVKGDIWSFTVAEIFTNSLGMKFVRIEPGTFQMGSTNGDFDEVPVHNVTITEPFYISQFEVTNAEYEQFDPNHGLIDHRGFTHEPNEAVIFVSWEDANAFCTWLSQLEGTAYRLPTEAEWEHACRAGTTAEYYTGGTLPEVYYKNQVETWGPNPQPLHVGQTPSNQWGLYDMHGNVEEWCWDWYGPYEANDQTDPVGRVDGRFRVSRGGSHSTTVDYLRSANRMGTLPEDKHWMIGFRPVLAELPTTEPLPEPPPELYQIDVDQTVPPDINQGPDPDIPYFQGPRTYVKIPPGSDGPLFSAHNHDPGFTECPNGDLLAIWYTTIREPGRELALAASRLRYGRDEWEDASPFWDAPDRNDHAPALWIDESGKIYHFVGLGDAATWGGAALIMRTSMDNGVTWSRARLIDPEHTYDHMPVESIFRANDGAILLPSDKNPGTHIYLSYDNGQTWFDPGGRIYGIHAGVIQLNDDRLMAFGRREEIDNKMPMSISADMGASWTYSASEFPPIGGGQRPVVLRLKEGPILFISFTGDDGMMIDGQTVYGMFAALSYDEGQTWPVKKLITAGGPPTQYDGGGNTGLFIMDDTHAEPRGYLAITQTPNGVIQLISSALHYRFNLAWLEYKEYVLIDDLESYTDDGGENPVGDTWQDNSSDPDNGTVVTLETAVVRGYKSMKVDYDTAWPYCRAVRTYSLGQNWATGDVKAMSLWFYGSNYNSSSDQMYVLVKDMSGNIGLSLYAGEANDIAEERWQRERHSGGALAAVAY
jgi:formylglycine-generating enzyme required for sulfatase activity